MSGTQRPTRNRRGEVSRPTAPCHIQFLRSRETYGPTRADKKTENAQQPIEARRNRNPTSPLRPED